MSHWNIAATSRAKEERDRACRALLEEAERLANAFHEGWLRNNKGTDHDRQRGEPPVPLKAFQYVARIARAGLENETALAFLGPVRLGDWPLFPGRVASHPLTLAMIRWIDFLRGENRDARAPLPSLRPAHLYWLEHHGREKLGFCRLALAESERLVERYERERWHAPREMLEIVDDVRLAALDEARARQLRAFTLLLRAEGNAIGGYLDEALADLPEVEWLCGEAETGGSALWRLEIEVGLLETRGLIALRRQRATGAPPSEDAPRAAEKLRRILHEPHGSSPTRDLWLGRLCEVLMLESSSTFKSGDLDTTVAALREALGRLPETGPEELRFAATLRLGVSEFNRGDTEAAWACAEALPELEDRFPTWYLEAQRCWLVGSLHRRALEEGETQAGSEESSAEAMRKHLEKAAELCELHGGRKGVSMALRELDVLARFYRERERADEYLEMLCRIGEYRNKTFYGSYHGPFCRYEVI